MKVRYLILIAIAGTIVTCDQAVKMYIHTHFVLHESIAMIPGYFNMTYVRNPGAAFGFLADSMPWFRELFFLSMPPAALLIILAIMRGVNENDHWTISSLSLVFGGAVGNYIDRLRFRYVIDFLDIHYKEVYHWPSFNVADMAIVCGVGILLFLEFTKHRSASVGQSQAAQTQQAGVQSGDKPSASAPQP